MRDFDTLDTHSFKPFYFAAETLSFTQAARRAGMTQSGVSQHIARLESQLGSPLFLRIHKRVVLTESGRRLKEYVDKYLDDLEALKEIVSQQSQTVKGLVSYAMPSSCLMSPHFPLLLEQRRKRFPEIELRVTLCPSETVIEKLLAGEIDFGFVTRTVRNPAIARLPFCEEEYILIGADPRELRSPSIEQLARSRFLDYPGAEVLFDCWREHYFPHARGVTWDVLNHVGAMNSIEGVIEMAQSGMGLAIVPRHCVDARLADKRLFEYRGAKTAPILNPIHIVSLAAARLPRRCEVVIETFLEMKKG